MRKSKIFFWLTLPFILGIAFSSFYFPKIIDSYIFLVAWTLALFPTFIFWKKPQILIVSLSLSSLILGAFLFSHKIKKISGENFSGKEFSGLVEIVSPPEKSKFSLNLFVRPEKYPDLKFLIYADPYSDFKYKDRLEIQCVLKTPENKNADFDWKMHLLVKGVAYECQKPQIKKIEESGKDNFLAIIFELKEKIETNISRLISAPESGLILGIIIGGSDRMSPEIQKNFSRTGLTHIVAVSGYNVAIVANYLMIFGILLGLWRQQAFYLAVAGIIVFVILTGLESSAIRAGIMGILLVWAMKNGRLANSQNAILLAAVLMLFKNPLLFRWDIGFQLSFLATLGIVYLFPHLEFWFFEKGKSNFLGETILLTLAAQIFVLPVILINFKNLSLVSLLANAAVLPIIPLVMAFGFSLVFLSFIFWPAAQVFAWIAYLPLKYVIEAARFFSSFSWASVEMKFGAAYLIFWYSLLFWALLFFRKKKNKFIWRGEK